MIKKIKDYTPTLITYANTDKGRRFKSYLWNKDLIENVPRYKKLYEHLKRTDNTKGINNLNCKISKFFMNSEVAEVYIETVDRNVMIKKMKEENLFSVQKIEELLGAE